MIENQMKTAFITGGTKGIGYGVAESLITENYAVAFTGRSKNGVDEAVASLIKKYPAAKVLGFVADVRDMA